MGVRGAGSRQGNKQTRAESEHARTLRALIRRVLLVSYVVVYWVAQVKAAVEKNAKDIEAQAKPGSAFGGNLFVDPDFKAAKESLYSVNPALIASGSESGVAPPGEQVAWYRPSEIYKVRFRGRARVHKRSWGPCARTLFVALILSLCIHHPSLP